MKTCDLFPPRNSSDAIARRLESARNWSENNTAKETALILAERDPAFFVNEFCWTFDPRESPPFLPFDLYPDQETALRWIKDLMERGKDGVFEKSRDMGATWLTAAFAVWAWLFVPGATIGFGSRKLDLVDKLDDPKCIFEKIRFIIRNLPSWVLQARAPGFNAKTHDNYCKILNPASSASITGEGGDEIGRGGRTLLYFVDESAFLRSPVLVDQALSANSRCRIDVSTPRGSNNPFALKRHSGSFPVFTLHWKSDPRKTAWVFVPEGWEGYISASGDLEIGENILEYGLGPIPPTPEGYRVIYPWYEEVLLKQDPLTVAQEYDIDYSASLQGVIIPARWLRACVGLDLLPGLPVAGYDVAGGGSAENVYLKRSGPVVERIVRWKDDEPTQAAFKVIRMAEQDKVKRLFFDSIGVGAGTGGSMRLVRRKLGFTWTGVNVGLPPTNTIWSDKQKSKEKFANLKAELWWRVRARAERTYQYVVLGISHPKEDLLSLPPGPDTEALIAQLSGVQYFETDTGKIIVESKKQLKDRGVASPDIAEALILSFAPLSMSSSATRSGNARPTATPKTSSPKRAIPAGQIQPPHKLITGSKARKRGTSA